MNKHIEHISRVITDSVEFTWKIENFSSLQKKTGEFVQSPVVKCSDSQFFLRLYPNGKEKANNVDVILEEVDFPLLFPFGEYKVGFKDRVGQKRFSFPMISKKNASNESGSISPAHAFGFPSQLFGVTKLPCQATSPGLCASEKTPPSSSLETDQGISISRDGLFELMEDLFPDNVLTVLCEIKVSGLIHVSESSVHGEDSNLKHGSITLSKNIENLFDNSRFSDITLKVGTDTFKAHKNVLACRSKVFEAMFESGMKEGLESEVNMVEMKSTTAKEMLQYIYAGKIQELSMDRAMDLYVAADRYDLQELKGWCKDLILKHISADDVTKVAVMADLHRDEELIVAAGRVFKLNSKTILLSKAWEDFARENFSGSFDFMKRALSDEN